MRIALLVVVFFVTSVLPAVAGRTADLLRGAATVLVAREVAQRVAPDERPVQPPVAPASTGVSYPLEWGERGVVDASSCWSYNGGWRHFSCDRERMKSALEVAGQRHGVPLLAPDVQAKAAQARTSRPGYDPRTAPKQGLWRAPQGILSATITFAGYACREQMSVGRRWGSGGRWMKEECRVVVELVVSSVEDLLPVASARAEGSTTASFLDGELKVGGIDIGGVISRKVRPDRAIAMAAEGAMKQLASQLLVYARVPKSRLVVAQVAGQMVVITTTDGSDVRDTGVVEGMKYALHGEPVINPVTGKPTRGALSVGSVEIVSIDADIAQARLLYGSQTPAIGAFVTLEPYQSLHN